MNICVYLVQQKKKNIICLFPKTVLDKASCAMGLWDTKVYANRYSVLIYIFSV